MDPIEKALWYAHHYGGIDGEHHKQWVIDQMVRALLECPAERWEGGNRHFIAQGESQAYLEWVDLQEDAGQYAWPTGVAP